MIELKVDEFKNGYVIFQIERQDEEDYKILKHPFLCKNDVLVVSAFSPFCDDKTIGVRGVCKSFDKKKIRVQFDVFLKLYEAIYCFNNKT